MFKYFLKLHFTQNKTSGICTNNNKQQSSQLTFTLVRSFGVGAVLAYWTQIWRFNTFVDINTRNGLWFFICCFLFLLFFFSFFLFLWSFFFWSFWSWSGWFRSLVYGEPSRASQTVGVVGTQTSFASNSTSFISIIPVNITMRTKKGLLQNIIW